MHIYKHINAAQVLNLLDILAHEKTKDNRYFSNYKIFARMDGMRPEPCAYTRIN